MNFEFGYSFKSKKLAIQALTHPSAGGLEFERLEFLGDRVLGLCISQMIVDKLNVVDVKDIANKYSSLVNGNFLSKIALNLGLDKKLKHSIEILSTKVLADSLEALIGAVFLDSDYASTYEFIQNLWAPFLYENFEIDAKMQLQELVQKLKLPLPIYETISITGPDHALVFQVVVIVPNKGKGFGTGLSKNIAQKNAARNLLQQLVRS